MAEREQPRRGAGHTPVPLWEMFRTHELMQAAQPFHPCEYLKVCMNKVKEYVGVSIIPALGGWQDKWDFTVTINGTPHRWNLDDVWADTEHQLGWCKIIRLSASTVITVTAGGTKYMEGDDGDQLPAAINTHDAQDNWGMNQTHTLSATDGFDNYEVEYTITCGPSFVSMIGGMQLVERMLPVAVRQNLGDQVDESTLLSTSLIKLEQYGLRLKQMNGDTMVLEGPQSVQQLLDEIRPKGSPNISKERRRS